MSWEFRSHYLLEFDCQLLANNSWFDLIVDQKRALSAGSMSLKELSKGIGRQNKGSTPLNKLSIGIHANIVLCNHNFTPHVTIFWKFWWQKLLKQRLNFNLSLLWWCQSRILFEIKASKQRHCLFSLAWSPLHHIRPGPEFMRLRSKFLLLSE